jgi:hypothetical protein
VHNEFHKVFLPIMSKTERRDWKSEAQQSATVIQRLRGLLDVVLSKNYLSAPSRQEALAAAARADECLMSGAPVPTTPPLWLVIGYWPQRGKLHWRGWISERPQELLFDTQLRADMFATELRKSGWVHVVVVEIKPVDVKD